MYINKGPIAVAKSPSKSKDFLAFAKDLLVRVTDNINLPNPTPSVAVFGADLTAFDQAETKAEDETPASVADRNAKAGRVAQNIDHWVDYVQGVASTQASPAEAIAIILSAGFSVRRKGKHAKPPLAARYGHVSGEVLLVALAIAGAGAYDWEYSLDQQTWIVVPQTTKARTTIAGLTLGQVYAFRMRALTTKGKGDYTQVVSLLVH